MRAKRNPAFVYLTGAGGETRLVVTNSFGYYSFEDVAVGEIYIVGVSAKRYICAPQAVFITEEPGELNFAALE